MADPTLPSATVDTDMPDVSGYAVVSVPGDYADLQAALDGVSLGTIIELDANTEYGSAASGGDWAFSLPNKGAGTDWIIVTTAGALASAWLPPVGERLDGPSNVANMAKIVCNDNPQGGCVIAESSAHHYRFIGIEFRAEGNVEQSGCLFELVKFDTNAEVTTATQPHHMIVDRCYLHGPGTAQSVCVKFAFTIGGPHQALVDSYVDDIMNSDGEAKAVAGWNGNGPVKVYNNFLAASGITMMVGGADPVVPSDLISDVTVKRNYFYKHLRWRDDTNYTTGANKVLVKNHFELKGALRVLVEDNIFENCWVDGQAGYSIAISPIAGGIDTPATAYTTVQDVMFRNNKILDSAAGCTVRGGGVGAYKPEGPSVRGGRYEFSNNLFKGIGGISSLQDGGRVFDISQGPYDLHIRHNTVVVRGTAQGPQFHFLYGTSEFTDHHLQTVDGMIVQSNIFFVGPTSFMAFESTFGAAPYDPMATVAPDMVWTNTLVTGPWPTTTDNNGPTYPAIMPDDPSNWYTGSSDVDVGYTDLAGGDYSLAPGGTYSGQGHDTEDIGVDWAALQAATAGTVTGVWTQTRALGISGTSGALGISGTSGALAS